MNQHQRMVIFDADPGRLRTAAMVALIRMGATLVASDDDAPVNPPVEAITEPGIWSIGERITIRFADHGQVSIQSCSRQWLTLFDWFVNHRNVNRVEKWMHEHLQSHPIPAQPPSVPTKKSQW